MGKGTITGTVIDEDQATYPVHRLDDLEFLEDHLNQLQVSVAAHTDPSRVFQLNAEITRAQARISEIEDAEDITAGSINGDILLEEDQDVGLIEVPGTDQRWIHSSGESGEEAFYDVAIHGIERGPQELPAYTWLYNLIIYPAWLKWRPMFRTGEITEITADVCEVELDDATYTTKPSETVIDLNQSDTLTAVPFFYPPCHIRAFEVGDKVMVQFVNQDWNTPYVIGFTEDPVTTSCREVLVTHSGNDVYISINAGFDFENKGSFGSSDIQIILPLDNGSMISLGSDEDGIQATGNLADSWKTVHQLGGGKDFNRRLQKTGLGEFAFFAKAEPEFVSATTFTGHVQRDAASGVISSSVQERASTTDGILYDGNDTISFSPIANMDGDLLAFWEGYKENSATLRTYYDVDVSFTEAPTVAHSEISIRSSGGEWRVLPEFNGTAFHFALNGPIDPDHYWTFSNFTAEGGVAGPGCSLVYLREVGGTVGPDPSYSASHNWLTPFNDHGVKSTSVTAIWDLEINNLFNSSDEFFLEYMELENIPVELVGDILSFDKGEIVNNSDDWTPSCPLQHPRKKFSLDIGWTDDTGKALDRVTNSYSDGDYAGEDHFSALRSTNKGVGWTKVGEKDYARVIWAVGFGANKAGAYVEGDTDNRLLRTTDGGGSFSTVYTDVGNIFEDDLLPGYFDGTVLWVAPSFTLKSTDSAGSFSRSTNFFTAVGGPSPIKSDEGEFIGWGMIATWPPLSFHSEDPGGTGYVFSEDGLSWEARGAVPTVNPVHQVLGYKFDSVFENPTLPGHNDVTILWAEPGITIVSDDLGEDFTEFNNPFSEVGGAVPIVDEDGFVTGWGTMATWPAGTFGAEDIGGTGYALTTDGLNWDVPDNGITTTFEITISVSQSIGGFGENILIVRPGVTEISEDSGDNYSSSSNDFTDVGGVIPVLDEEDNQIGWALTATWPAGTFGSEDPGGTGSVFSEDGLSWEVRGDVTALNLKSIITTYGEEHYPAA